MSTLLSQKIFIIEFARVLNIPGQISSILGDRLLQEEKSSCDFVYFTSHIHANVGRSEVERGQRRKGTCTDPSGNTRHWARGFVNVIFFNLPNNH